jgi:hypothetical protein
MPGLPTRTIWAVGAVAAGLGGAALAQGSYDGSWAITVATGRGPCDPVYHYYVDVQGDTVRLRTMSGSQAQSASGLVRPDGRINVVVGQANDPVRVKGRLARTSGAGTWAAPARGCTGRWSAAKRG